MRIVRIGTLVGAPLLAALIAFCGQDPLPAAGTALALLWTVLGACVTGRLVRGTWDAADLLTATGRTTMWSSTGAIALAVITGWASLAVLGVLGLGVTCLAACWTAVMAGGDRPWRGATVRRSILPALCREGDPIREEIQLSGVRIPFGMRLFVIGRATRSGAITRYAIGAEGSGAELALASELGAAIRGEHAVPPLALSLGDVLGLTRTAI